MKLGLIIGRFQPFHNGHLSLIEKSRKENDKTLVLIGSSNRLPDFKHPLPVEERIELLADELEEGDDLYVRTLKDRPSDDQWVSDVIAQVLSLEEDPSEVTLYCASKDEQWYRENLLYSVVAHKTVNISATQIRHAWYTGSLWTVVDYMSKDVLAYLAGHPDRERLSSEFTETMRSMEQKKEGHPFGNPMEPVSFAVLAQGDKILVGKRKGFRGKGQLGLLGGYLQNDETTINGCIREVKEESGVDLGSLIEAGQAQCLASSLEENLDDIGTRTLGVNYLFVVHPDVVLELTPDTTETESLEWVDMMEVAKEDTLLFFNHNLIVQRLLTKVSKS